MDFADIFELFGWNLILNDMCVALQRERGSPCHQVQGLEVCAGLGLALPLQGCLTLGEKNYIRLKKTRNKIET